MKIRGVLNGREKQKKSVSVSQKSPRALHVLDHGWWQLAVGCWRLAVGNWRLVAVGGGWRRLVAGSWWLEAVGSGWQLAVGRRWQLPAVGGWRLVAVGGWRLVAVAVDGSWRLAVGGPLGLSLGAFLSKKKKARPLRTPVVKMRHWMPFTNYRSCLKLLGQGLTNYLHPQQCACAA